MLDASTTSHGAHASTAPTPVSRPTPLSHELLDLVERIESAAGTAPSGVLDDSTLTSLLDELDEPEQSGVDSVAGLVAHSLVEPSDQPPGYVLTSTAREDLREHWARSWADTFWPSEA